MERKLMAAERGDIKELEMQMDEKKRACRKKEKEMIGLKGKFEI